MLTAVTGWAWLVSDGAIDTSGMIVAVFPKKSIELTVALFSLGLFVKKIEKSGTEIF